MTAGALFLAALVSTAAFSEDEVAAPGPDDGLPICDACGGTGEADCSGCDATGKVPARCPVCEGKRYVPCPDEECSQGLKTCRTCLGKGLIKVEVLPIQGGSSERIKTCSTCKGDGIVECKRCERGKTKCSKCNGGKKTFSARCEDCGGKRRTVCAQCSGAGRVPPPPLDAKLVVSLERLRRRAEKVGAQADETRGAVEARAVELSGVLARAESFDAAIAAVRTVESAELTQYLERYRELLLDDWERYRERYIAESSHLAVVDEIRADLDEHVAGVARVTEEIDRTIEQSDGRHGERVEAALVELDEAIAALRSAGDEIEVAAFQLNRTSRKLQQETGTIQEGLRRFQEKLEANRMALAEKREREEAEKQSTPPDVAIRDALRNVNVETGLPQIKVRTPSEALSGDAIALEIEYTDSDAERIDDTYFALSERHLERVPEVVSRLFDARSELASVLLTVRARVVTVSEDDTPVVSYPAVQSFSFERAAWPAPAPSGDEGAPADATADWRTLLSRSGPSPRFPPPPPEPAAEGGSWLLFTLCAVLALAGIVLVLISRTDLLRGSDR